MTVVSAVLSIGTGYAFGTMRFRGDRIVFPIMLLGIIFPYEATVIPLYYDFQNVPFLHWNLLNTYWALILPQIGQSVAFGTFWMRAFFRSAPRVADRGGAHRRRRRASACSGSVLLPQAMPALLTLCVLVFIYTWNEFLLALVLVSGSQSHQTAPLGLSFFAGAARAGDPTKVAAAAVLVALPIVVVYLFLQRHFIRGMLGGCDQGVTRWRGSSSCTWAAARRGAPARWRRSCRTGADFDGSEVVLVDLDPDRLELIRTLAEKMATRPRPRHRGHRDDRPSRGARRTATPSSRRFRPGGFAARVHDERIPLEHGVHRPGDAGRRAASSWRCARSRC